MAVSACLALAACTGVSAPSANLAAALSSAKAQDAAPETEAELQATLEAETAEASQLRPKADVGEPATEPAETEVAVSDDDGAEVEEAEVAEVEADTEGESETVAEAPEDVSQAAETQLALAPEPKKPTNAFAAFLKANQQRRSSTTTFGRESVTATGSTRTRKPTVTATRSQPRLVARARNRSASTNALPGVNTRRIFSIEEDFNDDASQRKLDVTLEDPVRLAAVTNMARRGTHGLLLQRPGVKVGCFPPQLVRILKQVERKFGRTPVVTSGYRSASYNRKIRGAKNSMHVQCKAADIQVQGVSKWTLARYLRSLPGRGGVGTYCHTKSVHIDVGSERDWNRKCGRKRRRA